MTKAPIKTTHKDVRKFTTVKPAATRANAGEETTTKKAVKTAPKVAAKPRVKAPAPMIATPAATPIPVAIPPVAKIISATTAAVSPTGIDAGADAGTEPPVLRKKELIDRVVEMSGGKKKDIKPAVEATLNELGAALARGEDLNLPGLGKVMIKREKDQPNANVLICRIRQPKKPASSVMSPLAKPFEGS